MTASRRFFALYCLSATFVAGGFLTQCSSSSSPPPGGNAGGGGGGAYDAGGFDQIAADSPGPTDSPPPPPTDGDTLGTLPVTDVPDVPCIPNGGTTVPLYSAAGLDASPGGQYTPPLSRLAQAGGRRVGGGPDVYGIVTMGLAGTNPSVLTGTIGTGLVDFTSEGATIGVAGNTRNSILFQRFDANGTAQGSLVTLASSLPAPPSGVGVGGGDGQSLVVWGDGGDIHAQAVDSTGNPVGQKFTVATGAYKTLLYVSVAYAGNGVWGAAWTGDPTIGGTVSGFAVASTTGTTGAPTTVTTASFGFNVYKVIATSTGYAMLVAQPIHDGIYVILLDPTGKPTSALRYIGADIAWDIALQGTEMGLVVQRQLDNDEVDAGGPGVDASSDADVDLQPYQSRFRPLGANGLPLGPWVCVGQLLPSNGGYEDLAIDSDPGGGYAVAGRDPAGDEQLTIFNHLGQ